VKNSDYYLDLCQRIRCRRNEGIKQLQWPTENEFSSRRVRVGAEGTVPLSVIPCAEKAVVVTAIPDGRLRPPGSIVEPPARASCKTSCISPCLFTPEPALITVLSCEPVDSARPLDQRTRTFLDWYKACERAIWGNAHGSVGELFSKTLVSWRRLEAPLEARSATVPILTGLLEEAVQQRVFIDFAPIIESSEVTRYDDLRETVMYYRDLQGEVNRPEVTPIEPEALGKLLYGTQEQEEPPSRAIGNWSFVATSPTVEGRGTSVEVSVQPDADEYVTMRVVPSEIAMPNAVDDVIWGISSIIAADSSGASYVHDLFADERAFWVHRHGQDEEPQGQEGFFLGKTIDTWSPLWPRSPFLDERVLRDMHDCCPECDILADAIENSQLRHPFWGRSCLYRSRAKLTPWWPSWNRVGWTAFVTNDARGFSRLPIIAE
jgi:hypothetical protein